MGRLVEGPLSDGPETGEDRLRVDEATALARANAAQSPPTVVASEDLGDADLSVESGPPENERYDRRCDAAVIGWLATSVVDAVTFT